MKNKTDGLKLWFTWKDFQLKLAIFQTETIERVSEDYQETKKQLGIQIQRLTKNSLEYHNPQTCIPVHLDHLDNHVFHHSGDCCQCTSGPRSSTRWCWGWCWTRCCCTRTGRERTPSYLIHDLQQGCNISWSFLVKYCICGLLLLF